jgi:hypothetical protein
MTHPLKRLGAGHGQVAAESHPNVKIDIIDVALLRLLAAEGDMPRGLITAYARARRVTSSCLCMAISGDTWADVLDPPPVPAGARVRTGIDTRPRCPGCGQRKYQGDCTAAFHRIDHRRGSRSRRPVLKRLARRHSPSSTVTT